MKRQIHTSQNFSEASRAVSALFRSRTFQSGFTLIETLVAISLLTIAITAPMLLTVQSLTTAYYARDQIVASHLAQEAIEEIHQIRDGQILLLARTAITSGIDIFGTIPKDEDFTVDAHKTPALAIVTCTGACLPLQTDPTERLYGYGSGWTNTKFTRTVRACFVHGPGVCNNVASDELRLTVTVSWQTGNIAKKTVTMTENLYRWVKDGSAI